jgi:hypothetical protein
VARRFKPRRKLELIEEDWRRVLHHVTVEVLALAQAGRDVNAVYTERAVRLEDWKRTANVLVKQTDGATELQLPTSESLEPILKAMPQSLAEEIVKAAENAEMAQTEDGAEELHSDVSAQQNVDAKEIDAEEKATMRAIKQAIYQTRTITDTQWLWTPLTDPAIKLAVSGRRQCAEMSYKY